MPGELRLGQDDYLTRTLSLGSVTAVLQQSLTAALAPYRGRSVRAGWPLLVDLAGEAHVRPLAAVNAALACAWSAAADAWPCRRSHVSKNARRGAGGWAAIQRARQARMWSGVQVVGSRVAIFGEEGLVSGRRRGETVTTKTRVVLLETPRNTMAKLARSVEDVRRAMAQPGAVGSPPPHGVTNSLSKNKPDKNTPGA